MGWEPAAPKLDDGGGLHGGGKHVPQSLRAVRQPDGQPELEPILVTAISVHVEAILATFRIPFPTFERAAPLAYHHSDAS